MPFNEKIIFAGLTQNSSQHLPAIKNNLSRLKNLFSESAIIIIENDSSDNTKKILLNWKKDFENFYIINIDGLNKIAQRTDRLEFARNCYIEIIKNDTHLRTFDYLCVMDFDDISTYQINLEKFSNGLNFLKEKANAAAIFANQIGSYYDLWAFRHEVFCPNDFWEKVLDYTFTNKCTDQIAFDEILSKINVNFDTNSEPIEVNSAFGGLGLYKMQYILQNKNPYIGHKTKFSADVSGNKFLYKMQTCEHVHFNQGIRNIGGKLFIFPSLINHDIKKIQYNPSFFRGMIFDIYDQNLKISPK